MTAIWVVTMIGGIVYFRMLFRTNGCYGDRCYAVTVVFGAIVIAAHLIAAIRLTFGICKGVWKQVRIIYTVSGCAQLIRVCLLRVLFGSAVGVRYPPNEQTFSAALCFGASLLCVAALTPAARKRCSAAFNMGTLNLSDLRHAVPLLVPSRNTDDQGMLIPNDECGPEPWGRSRGSRGSHSTAVSSYGTHPELAGMFPQSDSDSESDSCSSWIRPAPVVGGSAASILAAEMAGSVVNMAESEKPESAGSQYISHVSSDDHLGAELPCEVREGGARSWFDSHGAMG